jgi:hypothetical protein
VFWRLDGCFHHQSICWNLSTRLHGITYQKIVIFILIALRTSAVMQCICPHWGRKWDGHKCCAQRSPSETYWFDVNLWFQARPIVAARLVSNGAERLLCLVTTVSFSGFVTTSNHCKCFWVWVFMTPCYLGTYFGRYVVVGSSWSVGIREYTISTLLRSTVNALEIPLLFTVRNVCSGVAITTVRHQHCCSMCCCINTFPSLLFLSSVCTSGITGELCESDMHSYRLFFLCGNY